MGPMKALIALFPVCTLLLGALIVARRGRTVSSLLQLVGAVFLIAVVLAHVSEAFHLLPWMGWGREHSPGHFLDLASAVLGLTLFPVGYLAHALAIRSTPP